MAHRLLSWPGKSFEGGLCHAAAYHMLDVGAVAEVLTQSLPEDERDLCCLFVALHDLGKIGAEFQAYLTQGQSQDHRHWQVTEAWLQNRAIEDLLIARLDCHCQVVRQLAAAVAGHHGKPPQCSSSDLEAIRRSAGRDAARDVRTFVEGCLDLWPLASWTGKKTADAKKLSWWLSGLTVVSDWIGSNPAWFPPVCTEMTLADYLDVARQRARVAVVQAGLASLPAAKTELFDFTLRPLQQAAKELDLGEGPTLVFLEDETGAGKTEAAFILAQRMMLAGKGQGIFYALPTMATADAMFMRADKVVAKMFASPPSLVLAHGRSSLSQPFREVRGRAPESDDPVCHPWLADMRRKALLAHVGVGTIDQALLSILPTKFSTLRIWGLASKILIVDEVHELGEPYLAQELETLLRLHAMYGGSAILLTATLPLPQRDRLAKAFQEGAGRAHKADLDPAYPSLAVVGGHSLRNFSQQVSAKGEVAVKRLPDQDAALDLLVQSARKGAACLWVRNAVDDAISAVEELRSRGISAQILHARFALCDRKRIEAEVLARFGKTGQDREGKVLIATQVVESSLDLDFDVMVSDLAPVAALVQRAGRLWRHMDIRPHHRRPVPEPILHVLSPDPDQVSDDKWLHQVLGAGAWVYPVADQWRSAAKLFQTGKIITPFGLRELIDAVHGLEPLQLPPALINAEIEALGKDEAIANHARQNVINIELGYRDAGAGHDDREYPTRLGQEMRTLLLLRQTPDGLRPWAEVEGVDTPEAELEMLSEVSASKRRLCGYDLAEMPQITSDWPVWKRKNLTPCVVQANGKIVDGLHYDPDRGLRLSNY